MAGLRGHWRAVTAASGKRGGIDDGLLGWPHKPLVWMLAGRGAKGEGGFYVGKGRRMWGGKKGKRELHVNTVSARKRESHTQYQHGGSMRWGPG